MYSLGGRGIAAWLYVREALCGWDQEHLGLNTLSALLVLPIYSGLRLRN